MIENIQPSTPSDYIINPETKYLLVEDHYGKDDLSKVSIPHTIKQVLSDHYCYNENIDHPNVVFWQQIFLRTVQIFRTQNIIKPVDLIQKTAFSFFINKKRINRNLLLGLINYYNLSDFDYTLAWSNIIINDSDLVGYIENDPGTSIDYNCFVDKGLSMNKIKQKIVGKYTKLDNNQTELSPYGGNIYSWQNGLKDIISGSAIHIILEPVHQDRAMMFTEKTFYSILGMNFPIWVGGYKQADLFESLGFDNFSDVIDHSYQYEENFFDRCARAVRDNLHLLNDSNYIHQKRVDCLPRFKDNIEFLNNNELIYRLLAPLEQVDSDFLPYIQNEYKEVFDFTNGISV